MSSRKTTGKAEKLQADKFAEKARELGCDEDETVFEDQLRRIVPKPKKDEKAPEK